MKKLNPITAFVAGLLLAGTLAFTAIYEPSKATAEVDRIEGVYIFTNSLPVMEYEVVGKVKASISFGSGQYTDVRSLLIKKCKKEYPEANGLIMYFVDGGTDRAEAIKFK
jgi:hypothetical protein